MSYHNEWQFLSTYWSLPLLLETLNQKHQESDERDNQGYAAAGHQQTPNEKQNIPHNLPPEKKEVNKRRQSADSDYQAGDYKDYRRQFCNDKEQQ